ncbi:protoporphyrinogen/coproporphyrinogen oxidase [Rhabdochromatium marinum]|uniref:protoporphyrinogen/coproporphyrinogen oxidase n=1 Tax=Rhabdochromatium marinum TaxID=48729 RepID=UPI00190359A9|nr:FAD-dependent oxidoreductase [Rhabdochromatium marinum]MBK1647721.1 amine oxidase [Rhabdochromatium marinum]
MNQPASSDLHPHLVIGGGISGLGAAFFASRAGTPTLVLEQQSRVGGCMNTQGFDGLGDFWVEAGSHSCFNSYGHLLEILERIGLLSKIQAKAKASYRLWRGGQRASILSALHPLELLTSLPRLFKLNKEKLSVYEYYGRGLGRKNYSDLFGPAFRSVICQTADDYPASALFRKKPRRKEILRSFTMPGGLAEIPRALAAQDGIEVRLESAVVGVTLEEGAYRVELDSGASLRAQALTLAVPPDVATRLLQGVSPAAAAAIGMIGVAEIDSLLLAFDKKDLKLPAIAGLISVDGPFLSAVSRDFLEHPQYRGFAFHFPGGRLDTERQIEAACQALDVAPSQVAAVRQEHNRLPSLRKSHGDWMARLNQALQATTAAGHPLAVTGNWFLGVSIEDCVTRSHDEMTRLFAG